jgi:DNA-binding transcriptional LysR family regulator
VDPAGRLIIGVDAAPAAIELACKGHGILATFQNWLDPYLESGELQPVLLDWWTQFEGPWLYFSSRRMPAPLSAFVDFLAENASGSQPGPP